MMGPAAGAAASNGAAPPTPTSSVNRKRLSFRALLPPLLALAGLLRFSTSFFLARRSLAAKSACGASRQLLTDVLGLSSDEVSQLVEDGYVIGENDTGIGSVGVGGGEGCWVPRTVDAAIIVVVDALRFDFAVGRLPKSIGSRLRNNNADQTTPSQKKQSRLFTFVADPPTVTMQRLKGLTTGGLPTFADISGNFGGASIDEDSWVQQLHDVPIERRMRRQHIMPNREAESGETKRVGARMAFVGDDTWVDLFPTQFDDSNPYPSFNTRDLDTVDDGCMEHLPRLLSNLGGGDKSGVGDNGNEETFELVVAHFLGVDHVGHTYGPHDQHMTEKLAQIDDALSYALETIDSTPTDSCRAALVFGDHGMTEDGNHGGGTEDETNAALFVHYSKGCGGMGANGSSAGAGVGDADAGVEAFESIHQIDLVPTISAMLGLPTPYANLGGLVPALLPTPRRSHRLDEKSYDERDLARAHAAAAALALNAAQIWNYLGTYSRTANKLPTAAMLELKELLDKATEAYRTALSSSAEQKDGQGSLVAYREACSRYKLFLSEATELGKRVWTRFDTNGMILGGVLLALALLTSFSAWNSNLPAFGQCLEWIIYNVGGFRIPSNTYAKTALDVGSLIETGTAILFMIFHCLVLTFSNSYIESESDIIMFLLGCLCISMSIRQWISTNTRNRQDDTRRVGNTKGHSREAPEKYAIWMPILVSLCSRTNELLVSGHGLDPSIRMHAAHDASAFLTSLAILATFRLITSHFASIHRHNHRSDRKISMANHILNHWGVLTDVICLTLFAFSWWEKRSLDHSRNGYKTCQGALLISLLGVVFSIFMPEYPRKISTSNFHSVLSMLFKVLIFTVGTMGPAAAASSVLFLIQAWALYNITMVSGLQSVSRQTCPTGIDFYTRIFVRFISHRFTSLFYSVPRFLSVDRYASSGIPMEIVNPTCFLFYKPRPNIQPPTVLCSICRI